jgi:3-methylfumaryl-CoA hydratase
MSDHPDTHLEYLREWIGRTQSETDEITAGPVAALSATLDRDDPPPARGDPLPALWHWLYFLPRHRQSDLGLDGHARLGGFLPPLPLPRRMYAGGRVDRHRPLRIGDAVSRVSRITDVQAKSGSTGALVFVRVRHEISNHEGLALTEDQDIVYRANPKPGDAAPPVQRTVAVDEAAWTRDVHPEEVLLFRYSALTFNGYRPHYDRRFALDVQGYPGLVVHGPLIATLLADLLRHSLPDAGVSQFAFRAIRPLFDTGPFVVCGRPSDDGLSVKLWAREPEGAIAVEATASLA